MSVSLVHEWLTNVAGSEKVVAALRRTYPGSPVSTSVWWPPAFPDWDVRSSWLQRFADGPHAHVKLLPALPAAFATLRVPPADLVITSFHTFALYARVDRDARHVVYCHTPPRFLWLGDQLDGESLPVPAPLARAAVAILRPLDRRAARRPDLFLANSRTTAERVRAAYGVDAEVVYPPVDVERFAAALDRPPGGSFLVVSRLVPYKQVELAVAACTELQLPLDVVGTGRHETRLRAMAGPTVRFLGHLADEHLPGVMAEARALLFPGVEDFGIVPVEAMAAGTPVIARRAGGARETVEEHRSGLFFDEPTVPSLADAIRRFERTTWDRNGISASVRRFAEGRFAAEIRALAGPG